jgi:hypothetical protein
MQSVVTSFEDFFGQRSFNGGGTGSATSTRPTSSPFHRRMSQRLFQDEQLEREWWTRPAMTLIASTAAKEATTEDPLTLSAAAPMFASVRDSTSSHSHDRPRSVVSGREEAKPSVGLAGSRTSVSAPRNATAHGSKQRRMLTEDEAINLFADQLVVDGIRLVCFDFDKTLVPHPSPKDRLSKVDRVVMSQQDKINWSRERITPLFPRLVRALEIRGIFVAICTFNESELLKETFKGYKDNGRSIPVFARQDSDRGTGKLFHIGQSMKSVNAHLVKKAASTGNTPPVEIGPANTMLIDDLKDNADEARLWKLGGVIHNMDVFTVQDLLDYVKSSRSMRAADDFKGSAVR